jgi:hypothetical protein
MADPKPKARYSARLYRLAWYVLQDPFAVDAQCYRAIGLAVYGTAYSMPDLGFCRLLDTNAAHRSRTGISRPVGVGLLVSGPNLNFTTDVRASLMTASDGIRTLRLILRLGSRPSAIILRIVTSDTLKLRAASFTLSSNSVKGDPSGANCAR